MFNYKQFKVQENIRTPSVESILLVTLIQGSSQSYFIQSTYAFPIPPK